MAGHDQSYTVLRPDGRPGMARIGVRTFSGCPERSRAACIWLPGRLGNFDAALLGRPQDPRAVLASAGLTLHAVDYRTHFVDPADVPRAAECAAWGMGVLLDDVHAVIRHVRRLHPGRPVIIIGHSTGARLAYLCASRLPEGWLGGLAAIDGWVRNPPGGTTERDLRALRADVHRWHASGGSPAIRPGPLPGDGLSPRLLRYLLDAAREPDPRVGRMIGRAADDESACLVARCLLTGDRCWPVVAELEARAMAFGITVPGLRRYDHDLPAVRTPLFSVIAGDRGDEFTLRAMFTSGLLRQAPRRELMVAGAGHMDLVIGSRFRDQVAPALAGWIRSLGL